MRSSSGFSCSPRNDLAPLRPVDADRGDLGNVGVEEGLEQGSDLVRLDRGGALAREELGDLLVAGDVAFATEDTPVDREAWEPRAWRWWASESRKALAAE